jgi:hypothetical protein
MDMCKSHTRVCPPHGGMEGTVIRLSIAHQWVGAAILELKYRMREPTVQIMQDSYSTIIIGFML